MVFIKSGCASECSLWSRPPIYVPSKREGVRPQVELGRAWRQLRAGVRLAQSLIRLIYLIIVWSQNKLHIRFQVWVLTTLYYKQIILSVFPQLVWQPIEKEAIYSRFNYAQLEYPQSRIINKYNFCYLDFWGFSDKTNITFGSRAFWKQNFQYAWGPKDKSFIKNLIN